MDMEALKAKTCGCKQDAACLKEAIVMANAWGAKHGAGEASDDTRTEELLGALLKCDKRVFVELSRSVFQAIERANP